MAPPPSSLRPTATVAPLSMATQATPADALSNGPNPSLVPSNNQLAPSNELSDNKQAPSNPPAAVPKEILAPSNGSAGKFKSPLLQKMFAQRGGRLSPSTTTKSPGTSPGASPHSSAGSSPTRDVIRAAGQSGPLLFTDAPPAGGVSLQQQLGDIGGGAARGDQGAAANNNPFNGFDNTSSLIDTRFVSITSFSTRCVRREFATLMVT